MSKPQEHQSSHIPDDDFTVGDFVVSTDSSDYGCLLGVVTSIDRLGTPEHDTENDTDDIHVDFTVFDYPPERISEIEERFSRLYGEPKTFDDLPLDDVIMAPEELIYITNMSDREIERLANSLGYCEAFCNRISEGNEPIDGKPPVQAIQSDRTKHKGKPSIADRLAVAAVEVDAYKEQAAQGKSNKSKDITL